MLKLSFMVEWEVDPLLLHLNIRKPRFVIDFILYNILSGPGGLKNIFGIKKPESLFLHVQFQ